MYYVTLQGIDSVTERIVWGERGAHWTQWQGNIRRIKSGAGKTRTLGYYCCADWPAANIDVVLHSAWTEKQSRLCWGRVSLRWTFEMWARSILNKFRPSCSCC